VCLSERNLIDGKTVMSTDPEPAAKATIPPQNSILLCMEQVCEYLGGMSERKIYELISAEKLPRPIKFDRVARWRRSDLEHWVENLPN
jgi:predicted DNA-binding transcriptional regulator AlpA